MLLQLATLGFIVSVLIDWRGGAVLSLVGMTALILGT